MAERNEFVFARVFDAPRKLVFKVWSDAMHLVQWWGPKGSDIEVKTLEFRPGGIFHYSMSLGGSKMWAKFVYREIVEPERIVFASSFADEEGNSIQTSFISPWPLEILNTLTLTENARKTTLTIKGAPINATGEEYDKYEEMHQSMQQGFGGTFDQLAAYLQKIK
jgi:uncharacterized protein YndB with AHSA1/START domain